MERERECALTIINSDQPAPPDNNDLAIWVNEMSKAFAESPFSTDIEMSQFLWNWLPHIRATRQLGIDIDGGDLDE